MSLHILATGTLIADPISRTSAKGAAYATAQLRVPVEDDEAAFVSVIAFGTTAQALLAHAKGDSIAVTGRGKLTEWQSKDGENRHGLSITVDALMSPHQARSKREKVTEATT